MKLLFDQNISYRLPNKITHAFAVAHQVNNLGLNNAADLTIWEYAKANGYAIVTFDADFVDIANLHGCPPKIIWLRVGNMTTNAIAELLLEYATQIEHFLSQPKYEQIACLEIY